MKSKWVVRLGQLEWSRHARPHDVGDGIRLLGSVQYGAQIGALAIDDSGEYFQVNGAYVARLTKRHIEKAMSAAQRYAPGPSLPPGRRQHRRLSRFVGVVLPLHLRHHPARSSTELRKRPTDNPVVRLRPGSPSHRRRGRREVRAPAWMRPSVCASPRPAPTTPGSGRCRDQWRPPRACACADPSPIGRAARRAQRSPGRAAVPSTCRAPSPPTGELRAADRQ